MQINRQLQILTLLAIGTVSGSVLSATIQEDFSADPSASGWQTFGDPTVFSWDSTNQNLRVTWDSSRTNSYFYHPLGTTLSRQDNFSCSFDLRLTRIGPGLNTNKTFAFEIALGFLNLADATSPGFLRGTGVNATNLVEFDYFRNSGYGATVWPQFVASDGTFNYNGPADYTIYELTPGDLFHVAMNYSALDAVLTTTMSRNGVPAGPIHSVQLSPYFDDFAVNAFSISSYSDAGDDWDSVLAQGVVDNLQIVIDPQAVGPVMGAFSGTSYEVQFRSRTNWVYTLERAVDLQSWTPAGPGEPGTGSQMVLQDLNPPPGNAFYRVQAQAP